MAGRTPNGLLIPPRFSFQHLLDSPRFAMQKTLLQLPHAEPQNYTEQVTDVLALIAGTYRSPEGEEAHVVPGEGAALQVWILGSSGGESAEVAGRVWSDADRELVADRIDTQFTGTPGQVADQLECLRDATEADELIITTITHDHANRVRSYQLLAEEWAQR